jgi:hypothetical protein
MRDGNVMLMGDVGCAPGPDLVTFERGKRGTSACAQVNERAWQEATTNPRVDSVVLALRGAMYVEGRGFGSDRERRMLAEYQGRQLPGLEALRLSLSAGLDRLRAAGIDVTLVLDWAELPFTPYDCLSPRPVAIWRPRLPGCEVRRSVVDARQELYRGLVRELAGSHPELRVIDALEWLCVGESCPARSGDTMLYFDDDHLSPAGAEQLWRWGSSRR